MLFIVTLFAAITKTRFSGLKWSSATILFHTYRKFDVNLPKTPSFCKKNASFIENNLPFMGIMFLSRKEAKGSSFRCLAIPAAAILFLAIDVRDGSIGFVGQVSFYLFLFFFKFDSLFLPLYSTNHALYVYRSNKLPL